MRFLIPLILQHLSFPHPEALREQKCLKNSKMVWLKTPLDELGLSQAHCSNSKRCHQCPILPLAENGLELRDYHAVIVGSLERCGCGGVVVLNSTQRERHRRPGHTAHLPRVSSDHSESCHVPSRHLGAPCHRLRW